MPSNPPDAPDTGELAETVEPTVITAEEALVCWRALDRVPDVALVEHWPSFLTAHTKMERFARGAARGTFACPKCGKNTPHTHPPSDSGELERALEEFQSRCEHLAICRLSMSMGATRSGEADMFAARKSVLDLFERLQNRIAELERMLAGFDVDRSEEEHAIREADRDSLIRALEALDDVVPWEARNHGETLAQRIEYVKAELSSLRSTALTQDEAAHILSLIEGNVALFEKDLPPLEKLRSLSSLRSSSLGEQT